MSNCYCCDIVLTKENESDEHIILNACGGRLKSNNLLCRVCNGKFSAMDAELAKQLNFLSCLLDISRERGEPQRISGVGVDSGQQYHIDPGGKPIPHKPIVEKTMQEKRVNYSVMARNPAEFAKIIDGICKKFSSANKNEIISQAQTKREYLSEKLHVKSSIGGMTAFRSICKSAVDFYLYSGGDANQIKSLVPYLTGERDMDVVAYSYDEFSYLPEDKEVSHILYLRGIPEQKFLYCYLEFFNTYCFVIKLNSDYVGPEISKTYIYDVLTMQEIRKEIVAISFSPEILKQLLEQKTVHALSKVQGKMQRVLKISAEKTFSTYLEELTQRAFEKSLKKYPEGIIITQEMLNEFIEALMEEISPFLAHIIMQNEQNVR